MSSPEVSGRVHQPSHVQRECIAKEGTDVESIVERFVPQQVRHKGGNHEAAEQHQGQVVPGGDKQCVH